MRHLITKAFLVATLPLWGCTHADTAGEADNHEEAEAHGHEHGNDGEAVVSAQEYFTVTAADTAALDSHHNHYNHDAHHAPHHHED